MQITSDWYFEYREGDHLMRFFFDQRCEAEVFRQCMRSWEAPHDGEVISAAKQAEILARIVAFFTDRGLRVHVFD